MLCGGGDEGGIKHGPRLRAPWHHKVGFHDSSEPNRRAFLSPGKKKLILFIHLFLPGAENPESQKTAIAVTALTLLLCNICIFLICERKPFYICKDLYTKITKASVLKHFIYAVL